MKFKLLENLWSLVSILWLTGSLYLLWEGQRWLERQYWWDGPFLDLLSGLMFVLLAIVALFTYSMLGDWFEKKYKKEIPYRETLEGKCAESLRDRLK